MEGGVEGWFDKNENLDPKIEYDNKFDFEIKRQNDKMLREFGW